MLFILISFTADDHLVILVFNVFNLYCRDILGNCTSKWCQYSAILVANWYSFVFKKSFLVCYDRKLIRSKCDHALRVYNLVDKRVEMSDGKLLSDWRAVYKDLQEEQMKPCKNSSTVLLLSNHLITHNSRALGHNVWEVYEYLMLSSLDCSHYEIAKSVLSKLSNRFPKSIRVLVLNGMLLEAQGKTEEVLKLYEEIKAAEPLNRECRKRKVAVYKSKKQNKLAIQELCEYLSLFIGDTEAWLELSDLYIMEQDLYNAGFCMEELIITNPLNYLNHLKYAEICFTKGEEYWDTAAKHYTKVLTQNRDSLRALYGVILTFYSIMKFSKQNLQTKERKMVDWARMRLTALYKSSLNVTGCKMLENTLAYFDR